MKIKYIKLQLFGDTMKQSTVAIEKVKKGTEELYDDPEKFLAAVLDDLRHGRVKRVH